MEQKKKDLKCEKVLKFPSFFQILDFISNKIKIKKDGFVKISDLLKHKTLQCSSTAEILRITENCPKQRFLINYVEQEPFIRANQGHSLKNVELDMIKIDEASSIKECLHGTYYKHWDKIKLQGLSRMNRQHIHLSEDFPGSKDVISGMRNNCELAIYIDIDKALKGINNQLF